MQIDNDWYRTSFSILNIKRTYENAVTATLVREVKTTIFDNFLTFFECDTSQHPFTILPVMNTNGVFYTQYVLGCNNICYCRGIWHVILLYFVTVLLYSINVCYTEML